jgi:Zn-dependent protease/CBS domain-containing protein
MKSSLKLFQIFGIDIRVDWSWIFIFLLVDWNLSAGVFPQIHPDWSQGLNWALGTIAALLFFASVLAHELAHSLVAKAKGLPVKDITLFLLGGVSNIEHEPESPGTELLMAIVGPLTSIALGLIFVFAAGAKANIFTGPAEALAHIGPGGTLLLWLGPINILVGVFNLIPGFPLDGGRVLRAILWGITHNLRKATRIASWVGQTIAWIFIVAGMSMVFGLNVPLFGTGLVSGLWLAFIGWFLHNAAISSYQQVQLRDILDGVPVSRLMRQDIHTVPPGLSVADLVNDRFVGTDERAFPVMDGGNLLGLVCLEDVRKARQQDWDKTTVREIMTPAANLVILSPEENASDAFGKLASKDVRQLPVVQNGQLMGLLRRRDILKYLQLHSQLVAS